uniref:LIM zinc-binding domain-containing protein n=1 Tax=Wuchereria bancrofti TaxID=6293 RepID=A0A1I8ERX1_WUCBA
MEEDPYAVSSDTDTESLKGPPPKISIEGRSIADISSLKAALKETKEALKDEKRLEELSQLKKKSELEKIKKDFIEGKTKNELENEAKPVDEEREQLAAVTKEKYLKFRNKFENLPEVMKEDLEERLKTMEKELTGVGKENLENIKDTFENPQEGNKSEREQIVVERSEADKRRVMRTFAQVDPTADDPPKECAVCSKIVYPVERIFAKKRNYHVLCFKCVKCSKKLTSTNYNIHKDQLMCKIHYLEIFHPEIVKAMEFTTTEADEKMEDEEEDEEYAISSKPKQLGGTKLDDLSTIGSLKARKGDWENSAKETETMHIEKKNIVEEIISGKVKANLEKFVMRAANDEEEKEEDDEDGRDPNIVREDKKRRKEKLDFERVGDIKNKWKKGSVQTVDVKEMKNDLKELQNCPGVKERLQEMIETEQKVAKQWDSSELNTSGVADVRKSFLEGSAFQSGPIEKTTIKLEDLEFKKLQDFKERFEKGEGNMQIQKVEINTHAGDLSGIKSAFEKGEDSLEMTLEERAELKKKQIEEEFLRYKLVRRAAVQREAVKEVSDDVGIEAGAEIGVETIRNRFEKGDYSSKNEHEGKQLDVEIKMAGKARQKFQQIDAEGVQTFVPGNQQGKHISKWNKKESTIPEPVNRKVVKDEENEIEDEDAYDVKNLMQKFINIGREEETKLKHERPNDLDEIKIAARNLKEQFEKVGTEFENGTAEEKRRQLEEEFERLRREKEAAAVREETPEGEKFVEKEEIHVVADHASKMTAKWEKIQKKEAKKAEKSRMPSKNATQTEK